jgi:hypothetical protein
MTRKAVRNDAPGLCGFEPSMTLYKQVSDEGEMNEQLSACFDEILHS